MGRLLFILLFLLPERYTRTYVLRPVYVIDCVAPSTEAPIPGADGRYAPVFPGWGHYHFPISTSSDSAQFYFDQGLSLYYGYHLPESAASFKEATLMDGQCAMAYWGEALAMGPYYNIAYFYKMPAGVLQVLDSMNALANGASLRERDLISALNLRYSNDKEDKSRSLLNHTYSEGMKRLIGKYPGDNDIKALYIDGVMTEHAWDMWDTAGNPRAWTPELVRYCEEILKNNPDHPAALHYHIHLVEASLHPEVALASAERLKDLMPGVPHMVHMASHSYQRTGLYAKGVAINDLANADQGNFSSLAPQLHLGTSVIHYNAVEAFCAMNAGMYQKGIESAQRCRDALTSRGGNLGFNGQYLSTMPLFVLVRLGKWSELLDQPVPDAHWIYARIISDFVRGMAYVRTGRVERAQACLDSLNDQLKDPSLEVRTLPYNAPIKGASVAEGILEAEIQFARGKDAMVAFHRAITAEDGLSYLEPNDWPIPARQFAGFWLLRIGRAEEAEKEYKQDLQQNPGNGWSLLGLAQSLEAQHKIGAADYRAKAQAAFANADVMPTASVY